MNHKNTRKQGDHGLGAAIAYFCSIGWMVSIPLTDNQNYDLVVGDLQDALFKIQVKTTKYKRDHFEVMIASCGGNKTGNIKKPFDPTEADYLFIITLDNDKFLIPCVDFKLKNTLALGPKYEKYRVG